MLNKHPLKTFTPMRNWNKRLSVYRLLVVKMKFNWISFFSLHQKYWECPEILILPFLSTKISYLLVFHLMLACPEKFQDVSVCYERALCPVPTPSNIHFRHHTSDLSHNAPGRAVGRSPSWFCRGFRYSSTEWILLLSLTRPPELFEFWRNSVKEKMTGRQPACVIDNGTG